MAEYIKREEVRDMLHREIDEWGSCADEIEALLNANEKLYEIHAADVAPVVHGRWVNKQEKDTFAGYLTRFVCSECGRVEQAKEPYCHCGAKMDLKED